MNSFLELIGKFYATIWERPMLWIFAAFVGGFSTGLIFYHLTRFLKMIVSG